MAEELIAVNRDNDGEVGVLPRLYETGSQAKEAYDSADAARALKKEVDATTGRREKVKVALKKVGVSFSLESPLEASIRLPYIEMDGSSIERNGKQPQAERQGRLRRVQLRPRPHRRHHGAADPAHGHQRRDRPGRRRD